jgi:hypothetical protein
MPHTITTATLPTDVQAQYEIPEPIPGGPVLSFPTVPGAKKINFAKLTITQAAMLVDAGVRVIRRREKPAAPEKQTK